MSPGRFGVAFLQTEFPLVERREGESRFPIGPAVHCFGISTQGERPSRDGVEHFAYRIRSLFYRTDDPMRDIIGMNVMQHFELQVGQNKYFASGDQGENIGVRIGLRIDRNPTLANNVTWSKARGRKAISSSLQQKPRFDLRLVKAVGINSVCRVSFCGRDRGRMSIYPNGTAKQIMLDFPSQRLDQLPRSLKLEREHVDHNVWLEPSNPQAEFAFCFCGNSGRSRVGGQDETFCTSTQPSEAAKHNRIADQAGGAAVDWRIRNSAFSVTSGFSPSSLDSLALRMVSSVCAACFPTS
jgi:hypothetical protein